MNCLTRLLALSLLSLGAIGQGTALAALPSTLSTPSEAGDRDRFEVAQLTRRDLGGCVNVVPPTTDLYDEMLYKDTGELDIVGSVYEDMKVEILEISRNRDNNFILARVWNENGATSQEGYVRERDLTRESYDCRLDISRVGNDIPVAECALVELPGRLYDRPDGREPQGVVDIGNKVQLINERNPLWPRVINLDDTNEIGYISRDNITEFYPCNSN